MALPYFSAREVILVAQFAYKIYDAYTKSPGQLQALAREALTLESALKTAVDEAEKTFPGDQLSTQYRTRLAHLAIGAKELLKELDALLKKYESLATNKYSTWDRLLFGKEDVERLRSRIAFHASSIHGFQTDMVKLRTDGIGYVPRPSFPVFAGGVANGVANSAEVKQILEILMEAKSRDVAVVSTRWRETNTQDLYEALEKRGVSQEFMIQNSELIVNLIVDVVKKQDGVQQHPSTVYSPPLEYSTASDVRNDGILEEYILPCACEAGCTGKCLRLGLSPSLTLTDWAGLTAVGSPTIQSPTEGAKEVKESILHAVSKKLQQIGSTSIAHDGVSVQSSLFDTRRLSRISTDSHASHNTFSLDKPLRKKNSIASTIGSRSDKSATQKEASKTTTLSIETGRMQRKTSRSSTSTRSSLTSAPSPSPRASKSVFSGISKFAAGIGRSSYGLTENSRGGDMGFEFV